jgi:hypothetical protein
MSDLAQGSAASSGGSRNWSALRGHFLPATFEERGAAIPFTTPSLAHARIRRGWREGLELMIGDFAESGGAYVVPFATVRELVSLTAHDQMLYEMVLQLRALDPDTVRVAALETAATGLSGEAAARNAKAILAGYEAALAFHQVLLILEVLREVEGGHVGELVRGLKTREGQARIRATLGAIGRRLGMSVGALDRRLARLAELTYPIGLRTSPEQGRLRQALERLGEFEARLRGWGSERLGEAAGQARFAADVAAHTVGIANDTVAACDAGLAQPFSIIRDWEEREAEIAGHARRLSWLLDGWGPIIEMWFAAMGEPGEVATLARLVPVLPLVPRDEIREVHANVLNDTLFHSSRRWVRAHVDWRTGELDFELVERIEAAKARQM